ncbi:MAG: YggT family protein [Mycobacteriales bacterium]
MIAIQVVLGVLYLFLLLLIIRFVADWVQVLARDWRPHGAVAAVLELVYTATDPPIRALRRVLPPLRLGSVALDLSFMVIFFAVIVLIQVLGSVG